ncbi:hypothetical protein BGZ82_003313, partial [Podila clonocystis]
TRFEVHGQLSELGETEERPIDDIVDFYEVDTAGVVEDTEKLRVLACEDMDIVDVLEEAFLALVLENKDKYHHHHPLESAWRNKRHSKKTAKCNGLEYF